MHSKPITERSPESLVESSRPSRRTPPRRRRRPVSRTVAKSLPSPHEPVAPPDWETDKRGPHWSAVASIRDKRIVACESFEEINEHLANGATRSPATLDGSWLLVATYQAQPSPIYVILHRRQLPVETRRQMLLSDIG